MRLLVLLSALSMPLVAWWSQRGAFGPDNATLSDRYPTLLVAAGYAFAIWGPIFLCDALFAFWQSRRPRERDATLARIRPAATAGFALTALWMPVFSQQRFGLALLVIWAALACIGWCALVLSRDPDPLPGQRWLAWLPLSLHAGWLSLAALLDTAQTIVAYRLLPSGDMLAWSLGLYAVAAALLLTLNARMRGNWAYTLAALWGLVGVYVQQSRSPLPGATVAAWVALAIAAVLAAQSLWLRRRATAPARAG
ncbi:hypothetical protein [Lysobacter sp. Root604]|uniref:hypothetical protein n=1 Tax=Lysobacter sp. Root604 TaxID=1736568 RepID=UPI0007003623|nr:hypothetical protein [Lysobacter sp. Root604]KRA16256.1 hypothetical protein ASD69_16160 [Lysobacter sp. Root604]